MKQFWLILAVFLGLASTAVPASADIVWTLNQGSLGPSGTNYGTVTAHQFGTGTSAYVEVTITLASHPSGTPPTKNYLMASGSHTGIDWDMSVVPGAVTILNSTTPHSDKTKFTVQALNKSYADAPFTSGQNGNFNYAITPKASSGGSATENSIVFDITKTGGLALTDTLFKANNGGYYWAVDIAYNCKIAASGKQECSGTGVVASNSYVKVPEPGTWTMSLAGLTGLMGLMMLRRRKLARA